MTAYVDRNGAPLAPAVAVPRAVHAPPTPAVAPRHGAPNILGVTVRELDDVLETADPTWIAEALMIEQAADKPRASIVKRLAAAQTDPTSGPALHSKLGPATLGEPSDG